MPCRSGSLKCLAFEECWAFELADADRKRSNTTGMKRARSDDSIVPSDGAIVVDVGGVRYKTTRSTLSSGSGYFEARLNFDGKEDAGELFVDRDGALFHHILTHLRNNGLSRAVPPRRGLLSSKKPSTS